MCGIIGFSNFLAAEGLVEKGLSIMKNRGKDYSNTVKIGKTVFGHNLHSIVGYVKQPLVSKKGMLVINCEIYNWKELSQRHNLLAKNDAEMVFALLEKKGVAKVKEIIEELDGDFSFAYYSKKEEKIVLARDISGVKPLVYFFDSKNKRFAFASEKKALSFGSVHLNPRKIVIFDTKKARVSFLDRKINAVKTKKGTELKLVKSLLSNSVQKRVPSKELALLFSGGIDSTLLAALLKEQKKEFVSVFSFVAGVLEPKDLSPAREIASLLKFQLIEAPVSLIQFENELPKIISLIESSDPVRVGVASTIYFAAKKVEQTSPEVKVLFSGLGADELFAGYDRFKRSTNISKDCYSYFVKLYENDLYFQDIVCMYNKLELRVPFLDRELISFALSLNPKLKIDTSSGENKLILRKMGVSLGLPEKIAFRKKKAAQYGSNFDKAIEMLAKKNNFKSKADYLNSLVEKQNSQKNIPIAALVSTGKDSIYAMHLMQKQGYEIKCLVTIQSKNPDSFMFHTPTIELAKLQAKAIELPLIIVKTSGEKEKEISDLKKAIIVAREKYAVEGVCSGALFSNYQRERIESVCEQVGIRSFAPLWQSDQLSYIKALIDNKFKVMITKIAAFGLDETWLGKILDSGSIKKLEFLKKRYGINSAGEGGEYESLVLDAPFFTKKICVSYEKKLQNEFTGEIKIVSAKLVEK